jgi:hypothetical protein
MDVPETASVSTWMLKPFAPGGLNVVSAAPLVRSSLAMRLRLVAPR